MERLFEKPIPLQGKLSILKSARRCAHDRKTKVKTADAIDAIEGAPVSRYAQALSYAWAKGELTGEQMKQALLDSHRKLAIQTNNHE